MYSLQMADKKVLNAFPIIIFQLLINDETKEICIHISEIALIVGFINEGEALRPNPSKIN